MLTLSPSAVDNNRWLLWKLLQGFAGGTFGTTAASKYLPSPVDDAWTLTRKMLQGFADGSFTGTVNRAYLPSQGDRLENLTRKLLKGFADRKFTTGTSAASLFEPAPADDIWQLYRKLLQGFASGAFSIGILNASLMPSPVDMDRDLLAKLLRGFFQSKFAIINCVVPAPPFGLATVAVTSSSIEITWTESITQPYTGFRIKWGTSSGNYNVGSANVDQNTFTYTATGLSASTTYFFVVEALNGSCVSANSAEWSDSTAANFDPVVTDWVNRIIANGGAAPSMNTQTAANTFVLAMKAAGIWTKCNIINIFAPDSITAMLTPLKRGGGIDPWIIAGGGSFGSLTVNGLASAGGAGTHRLEMFDGVASLLSTCIASVNSAHASIYAYQANANATFDFGQQDGASNGMILTSVFGGTGSQIYIGNTANPATFGPAGKGNGFFCGSRTANNVLNLYFASSGTAWASIASDATVNTHAFSTLHNLPLYDLNNNGSLGAFQTTNTLSYFSLGDGFSSADGQNEFNAVQALRTTLGGGFR